MKPGDQVQLKSGGPIMTVEKVGTDYVLCTWFDAKNMPQSRNFVPASLQPYEEGPDGLSVG